MRGVALRGRAWRCGARQGNPRAPRGVSQKRTMNKKSRILVLGHGGLVGSALCKELGKQGYENGLTLARSIDLRRQSGAAEILPLKPDYVILAAATVGGIAANANFPASFIYDNLMIAANVIDACGRAPHRPKLLFLGSSCIYPRDCPQPIREHYLMSGKLEETNSAYATAKIAGIEMLKAYRKNHGLESVAVMPTNLYGPGDRYSATKSHVLPAMILRFHKAKLAKDPVVRMWGTGTPRREFLHSSDCAKACILLLNEYAEEEIVNVGSGEDISIRELAETIRGAVGFEGQIEWDPSKPDGTPRKLLDIRKLKALGWAPTVGLEEGIRWTYDEFLLHNQTSNDEAGPG
jgi:GDP-L-fucose synthase